MPQEPDAKSSDTLERAKGCSFYAALRVIEDTPFKLTYIETDRVHTLRQQLAAGNYKPNTAQIAEALLEGISRPFPGANCSVLLHCDQYVPRAPE